MTIRKGRARQDSAAWSVAPLSCLVSGIALIVTVGCASQDQGLRNEEPTPPATVPEAETTPRLESGFFQLEKLVFPPPQPGFERRAEAARGEWRVWVDGRVVDPRMHVLTWDLRLYRAVAGDPTSVELLAARTAQSAGRMALRADGAVLDGLGGHLVLIPARGPRQTIEGPQATEVLALYEDGFVGIEYPRDGYKPLPKRLVMTFFDGPPSRTLASLGDPGSGVKVSGPVRDGSRLAWAETVLWCSSRDKSCEEGTRVFAVDLSNETAPHELAWTPRESHYRVMFLDRLAGPWVVAHAGKEVHLLDWSGTRELRLACPRRVIAVQSGGVWHEARGSERDLVWWDPLSGRRIPAQAPFELEHSWKYLMTRDEERIMLPFLRLRAERRDLTGVWALSATPGKMIPLDAAELWDPNRQLRALGWSCLPGSREALLERLEVSDIHVRHGAFTALAACGLPGDTKTILGTDILDAHVAYLARSLAILGDPEAVPWLEARRDLSFPMQDQTDEHRRSVAEALSLLRERPEFNAAWDSIWP